MGVGTFNQPDFETQSGTTYKTYIDNCISVMSRIAASFAPHEQDTPDMTVRVDAGFLWVDNTVVEVTAQNTTTISSPATYSRIDRVVIGSTAGTVSVITGVSAATPTAPAITSGKLPICQISLATSTTVITNDLLTDERVLVDTSVPEAFSVNQIIHNLGTDPATELGYGTWSNFGRLYIPNTALLLHFEGTGATFADSSPHQHPITAAGGATQSATQKVFGAKAGYNDGASGSYLSIPNNAVFKHGTGDFTYTFWVYLNDLTDGQTFVCTGAFNSTGLTMIYTTTGPALRVYLNNQLYSFAWNPSATTWYKVTLCRKGTSLYAGVEDVQIGSTLTSTDNIAPATAHFFWAREGGSNPLGGYMDELIVKNGVADFPFIAAPNGFPDIYQWLRTA